jgi:hypothetical protein
VIHQNLLSIKIDLFKVSGLFPVAVLLIVVTPSIPVGWKGFVMALDARAAIEPLVRLAAKKGIVSMPILAVKQASAIWK